MTLGIVECGTCILLIARCHLPLVLRFIEQRRFCVLLLKGNVGLVAHWTSELDIEIKQFLVAINHKYYISMRYANVLSAMNYKFRN